MTRGLFTASHIYVKTSEKGDTHAQLSRNLPRVICINILGYNIRNDNTEAVQPYKILYTKPPQVAAIEHFRGYNVQLPRILEMPPDFKDPLYCIGYTLQKADKEKITISEVLEMTPAILDYAKTDPGFQQFMDLYNRVTASPEIQQEYVNWVKHFMREDGVRLAALEQGREEERDKWLFLMEAKDASIEAMKTEIAKLNAQIAAAK
jgi:hypothetical protein